ncbi:uncharacterized protein [Amphiura filiformis]|uniref:uncharacterized protein n=1 Tax=Amphiura filiformis TaxID=82378 RepID=UPI003B223F0C
MGGGTWFLRRMNNYDYLDKDVRWYLDATFKVVNEPFKQLLGFNCFVKKAGQTKQVPLVFVLMTGRTTEDYKAMFAAIQELLPVNKLKELMVDFEAAIIDVPCKKASDVDDSTQLLTLYGGSLYTDVPNRRLPLTEKSLSEL